jgi:hypothetical protein
MLETYLPRSRPPKCLQAPVRSNSDLERQVAELQTQMVDLQDQVSSLQGRVDAYDVTVGRMSQYQAQQARLSEEIRKLKAAAAVGVDAAPGEAGPSSQDVEGSAPASASRSDPLCSVCGKGVAYDMPLRGMRDVVVGPGKLDLADMFTPSGRVKAQEQGAMQGVHS